MNFLIARIIHFLFEAYTILLVVRILGSWFPQWQDHQIFRLIASFTDPFLDFFRRFIPPLGGRIDLSPILAFLALRLLESFIIRLVL